MNVLFNSDEMLDFCDLILDIIPKIKDCTVKRDNSYLTDICTVHSQVQNGSGTFQRARIFTKDNINTTLIGIGTPSDRKNEIVFFEGTGRIKEFTYYKKCNKVAIRKAGAWWGDSNVGVLDIPKYQYNAFEEQVFQLSCTEEYYRVLQFYMKLQMAFSSNLEMNVHHFDPCMFTDGFL